uniref:Uncharacterized protein n=1 Tax=Anopheles quadriannulatus TaxID=34691 RepID=A0A182XRW1_ANOQN
ETEKAAKKCNQLVLSSEAFFQPIFVWEKLTRLVKNYVAATTRTEATRKPHGPATTRKCVYSVVVSQPPLPVRI